MGAWRDITHAALRLEISQVLRWERDADSVQHGCQIDQLLSNRATDRRQVTRSGGHHPDEAARHSTDCTLQSDRPHDAANMNELVDFRHCRLDDYRFRSFRGDVANF